MILRPDLYGEWSILISGVLGWFFLVLLVVITLWIIAIPFLVYCLKHDWIPPKATWVIPVILDFCLVIFWVSNWENLPITLAIPIGYMVSLGFFTYQYILNRDEWRKRVRPDRSG